MGFVKTSKYFENAIGAIESAIEGTKKSLEEHVENGNRRAIDAHEAYIESCKKSLSAKKEEFDKYLKYGAVNDPSNIELLPADHPVNFGYCQY